MNLSKFFIDRPIFAGVLSVLIFLAGLLALRVMPISEYPEVVPPSVVVRAQYPGANPKVIAETVATPIEEQINGVEGMLYMSSQATTDGLMTLTVTFKLGTDPDKAQQLVQNRVAQAEPRLPEEVRRLGITTVKSSPDLTMVVHLLSPNDRYDMTYLRNYAVLNVKDRLARIDGVGQVQLFGSGDYSMRVWLDPQKVAERGLSASDVVNEIRAQNVQAAAGVVGASPGAAGHRPAAFDQRAGPAAERGGVRRHHRQEPAPTARSRACATSPASSSAPPNMRCARCSTTSRPSRSRSSRRRARTRSQISDNVRKTMDELKANMPEGVDYRIVYDPTQFVRASIEAVVHTLLEAVALVVLVVILFLQTWRASIIPLIAVPVSIIGTFAVMYVVRLLDQRADAVRPGAGDRHRRRRRHRRGRERRAQHRGGPVAARSDLPGHARGLRADHRDRAGADARCSCRSPSSAALTGQFYKQFALTIAISTVISAINSLTLSPALVGAAAQGPRRAEGRADAGHGLRVRLVLPRLQSRLRPRLGSLQRRRPARPVAQGAIASASISS